MAGLGAAPSVRGRLLAADAMLVIGCRLNEPTSYDDTVPSTDTPWAHVDVVPTRPAGLVPATLTVTADARTFLRAAMQLEYGLDVGLPRAPLGSADRPWDVADVRRVVDLVNSALPER